MALPSCYRPADVKDAVYISLSNDDEAVSMFKEQAARDWENFLQFRAKGIISGAVRIVISKCQFIDCNFVLYIITIIVTQYVSLADCSFGSYFVFFRSNNSVKIYNILSIARMMSCICEMKETIN